MVLKLFSRKKADGVIDAAHFDEGGNLLWVRAYERRGPTWSDRVLLDRPSLVQRLKDGRRFFIGQRLKFRASEFELGEELRLQETRRGSVLVVGKAKARQDQLDELPVV